jgi:hypothetical protein
VQASQRQAGAKQQYQELLARTNRKEATHQTEAKHHDRKAQGCRIYCSLFYYSRIYYSRFYNNLLLYREREGGREEGREGGREGEGENMKDGARRLDG